MRRGWWGALWLVACAGSSDEGTGDEVALADAAAAESAAVGVVGGTVRSSEAVSEDGHDLWEVMVELGNGAELEVLLFVDDGALFEVKDAAGPFDYSLDPLPGQLTYEEAQVIAQGKVEGEQVLWEVKWDDGRYFYEFYVMEVGDQLWEVKLWADDGSVFVTEPKDEVD